MEVHHHSHTTDLDSHRGRKKWTHYFWEFLMLFLAVFCGFLAENQREHYIEHLREKQYMRSMLQDLQTDTATMKKVYRLALIQKSRMDSLIELGNTGPASEESISKLYMLQGKTLRFLNIHFEDGTSSQLKNAGGMRLIRKKQVTSTIQQYWELIEKLYRTRDRLEMAGENVAHVSSRIFYDKFFVRGENPLDPPLKIKQGANFINNDQKLIAEYINRISTKWVRTRVYMAELEAAIQSADHLMSLIKEAYHPE